MLLVNGSGSTTVGGDGSLDGASTFGSSAGDGARDVLGDVERDCGDTDLELHRELLLLVLLEMGGEALREFAGEGEFAAELVPAARPPPLLGLPVPAATLRSSASAFTPPASRMASLFLSFFAAKLPSASTAATEAAPDSPSKSTIFGIAPATRMAFLFGWLPTARFDSAVVANAAARLCGGSTSSTALRARTAPTDLKHSWLTGLAARFFMTARVFSRVAGGVAISASR
jgi:hypothetical protein